jgi:hypothetical protein
LYEELILTAGDFKQERLYARLSTGYTELEGKGRAKRWRRRGGERKEGRGDQ